RSCPIPTVCAPWPAKRSAIFLVISLSIICKRATAGNRNYRRGGIFSPTTGNGGGDFHRARGSFGRAKSLDTIQGDPELIISRGVAAAHVAFTPGTKCGAGNDRDRMFAQQAHGKFRTCHSGGRDSRKYVERPAGFFAG